MTHDGRRPAPWRTAVAAVVLLAFGGAACTSPAEPSDPESALVQTVEGTLDGAFAYRLVAEADREALEALGRSLGSVAARLNLFEVTGVVDGDTATVDVQAFGTEPLFQLRRYGDDTVHVRIAAGDGPLAAVATPELEGRLLGLAVQTGQPDSVVAAIGALFNGSWVAITGSFDPAALAAVAGGGSPTDEASSAPTPLPAVVAEYLEVTDRVEQDGTTTVRVDLRVRALLRALASLGGDVEPSALEDGLAVLPETVTGDVRTRDGVVEAIVFDVAEGARAAGEDVPGSLQLRLELSEHGEPTVPEPPDPLVSVPSSELTAGLAQLMTAPVPTSSGSASPAAP